MDLVELLRATDATTVRDIARELRVSRRTVLRDLAALRRRGLPIASDTGPGGGIRLDRARSAAAVRFTVEELVAMWLAATLSRDASDLPWGEAATSALDKLLASLPHSRAQDLRALCRRVVIAPPASAAIREGAGRPPGELLRSFETAFSGGYALTFQYRDRNGQSTRRLVEPHGLLLKPPVWYILSRDVTKNEPRAFRMDRIAHARIVRTTTFRPDMAVVRAQIPPGRDWRTLLA
jgi:predicted DNA-binding transcriptional regulator YafY